MSNHETSYNQLQEQIDAGRNPTVLVPRSNGEITTGLYAGKADGERYRVEVISPDGQVGHKDVDAVGISDRYQEQLAEQLAGQPLRNLGENAVVAAGVAEPREKEAVKENDPEAGLLARMREIEAKYSEEDALNLWRYSSSLANKADAQKAGDGTGSIGFSQEAGRALKNLSPRAREDAQTHFALMQRLNRIRQQRRR